SETLDPQTSYMTIVVEVKDEAILEQIKKQLNKLIDVITVTDFTKKEHVDRELVLAKIAYSAQDKAKIEALLKKCAGKIIQAKGNTAVIEAVGEQAQVKELLEGLNKIGIKELVKTGRLAITN
ncbi:MAG: acetolactate synthase small subunit, partial [Candidatus Omnitrophica bacterium]|nr:acetolactate synthase small subunit [Candidatus Omnitrophota bacterium]